MPFRFFVGQALYLRRPLRPPCPSPEWNGYFVARPNCVENTQTLLGLPPKRLPLADFFARRKALRILVAITPDHSVYMPVYTIYVNP